MIIVQNVITTKLCNKKVLFYRNEKMELEIIRKISKVKEILIQKGFVPIPKNLYYEEENVESFVNEKFRVDIYPSGKICSTVEFHFLKDIEKYKRHYGGLVQNRELCIIKGCRINKGES